VLLSIRGYRLRNDPAAGERPEGRETLSPMTPESIGALELAARSDVVILDVRGPDGERIPGSRRLAADDLLADPTLPGEIGRHATIAGYRAWRESALPLEPR
jgi:hypothetical protein